MLFESTIADPGFWPVFVLVVTVFGAPFIYWLGSRRKTKAEIPSIHATTEKTKIEAAKTEIEAVAMVAREIPALLQELKAGTLSSIADQKKITNLEETVELLRSRIRQYRDRRAISDAVCETLRNDAQAVIVRLEDLVMDSDDDLLIRSFHSIKDRLERFTIEPPDIHEA